MTGDAFREGAPMAGWIREHVALRRPGRPGEVDRTLFMPLDPASEYVTGQVIAVDGGLTAQ
jgi:NAD(P)-dependent dehydrogenase (short-subunit alcohol dehydrogenase family)